MRFRSDEGPYKHEPRWIGNGNWTWPIIARFKAWGLFLVIFSLIMFVRLKITGSVPSFPLNEFTATMLTTWLLMQVTDHNRPLRSLFGPAAAELTAPRDTKPSGHDRVVCTRKVRIVKGPADE